ncbi:MAG: septum formation initiator family protein [Candidatus Omnitrophica bacterium]|nr:septum formation initiator family protein [Candidatus Omnitrophota bacterium]
MEKKKVIKFFGFLFLFIVIFLPGYSKYQDLAYRNRLLEEKIRQLEIFNKNLQKELKRLEEDNTYVEKIARDKLKVSKKGEIIYKIVDDKAETR